MMLSQSPRAMRRASLMASIDLWISSPSLTSVIFANGERRVKGSDLRRAGGRAVRQANRRGVCCWLADDSFQAATTNNGARQTISGLRIDGLAVKQG